MGGSYDLRPPTAGDLTRAHRRPTALVFGSHRRADLVVAPDRLDDAVVTLVRSRLTVDLRWDAALDTPPTAVAGWLIGGDVHDRSLTHGSLTGLVVTDGAPVAVGTPLETPLLRLLRADDRPRLTAALSPYARWAGGRPAPCCVTSSPVTVSSSPSRATGRASCSPKRSSISRRSSPAVPTPTGSERRPRARRSRHGWRICCPRDSTRPPSRPRMPPTTSSRTPAARR